MVSPATAFAEARQPTTVIARLTVKGKGVSFAQSVGWRGKAPNDEKANHYVTMEATRRRRWSIMSVAQYVSIRKRSRRGSERSVSFGAQILRRQRRLQSASRHHIDWYRRNVTLDRHCRLVPCLNQWSSVCRVLVCCVCSSRADLKLGRLSHLNVKIDFNNPLEFQVQHFQCNEDNFSSIL